MSLSSTTSAPRIGVLVVAYNAEATLTKTLDRIRPAFLNRISKILVMDDASEDSTFQAGWQWSQAQGAPPTLVIRHAKNLGYGGNQKAGYALAVEHGLDIVVLLHGDGQYAPELLAEMVAPIERGEADAVFGSRMMDPRNARRGGMPMYKWFGNRVLTRLENRILGASLTEYHSGYRAYRVSALQDLLIDQNSDDFDFDTQIIVQLLHAGKRIVEIPIPTHYGDEICYVNGMKYAKDVIKDVIEYRLAIKGFGTCPWVPKHDDYAFKEGDGSSHASILAMLAELPPSRILDLGCSGGLFAEHARKLGHTVTGVDCVEIPGVRERTDCFVLADLNEGLPPGLGSGYDVVVAGDVLEHLARPERLLREIHEVLRPGGELLASVPNFGHWYSRFRVALGIFDYDRRGILDETHLRFFTRASFRRTITRTGYDMLELHATGSPFIQLMAKSGMIAKLAVWLSRGMVRMWPTLFGYQYVARLTPHAQQMVTARQGTAINELLTAQRSGNPQALPAQSMGEVL
ncbi:glycosyltransferase [Streptomyces cynarae]|uniref:glycosyltransferase n=1 Tax=Streptomyces cynarae TaxID=2981134 RepID=UPI00406D1590